MFFDMDKMQRILYENTAKISDDATVKELDADDATNDSILKEYHDATHSGMEKLNTNDIIDELDGDDDNNYYGFDDEDDDIYGDDYYGDDEDEDGDDEEYDLTPVTDPETIRRLESDPEFIKDEQALLEYCSSIGLFNEEDSDKIEITEEPIIDEAGGSFGLSGTKTIIRFNKAAKKNLLLTKNAIMFAKAANDPMYKKLARFNKNRRKFMNLIRKKYYSPANSKAMKTLSMGSSVKKESMELYNEGLRDIKNAIVDKFNASRERSAKFKELKYRAKREGKHYFNFITQAEVSKYFDDMNKVIDQFKNSKIDLKLYMNTVSQENAVIAKAYSEDKYLSELKPIVKIYLSKNKQL